MMVVAIPEDSLVGGKAFPATSGQVSVGSGPEAQYKIGMLTIAANRGCTSCDHTHWPSLSVVYNWDRSL